MDKEIIDKFFELIKKANEENDEKAIADIIKLIGLDRNINELEQDVLQGAMAEFINRITSNEKNIEYLRKIGLKEENISVFVNYFIDSFVDEKNKLGLSANDAYALLTNGTEHVNFNLSKILIKNIAKDENLAYQLIVDISKKQKETHVTPIDIINSVQNPTQEFLYKCVTDDAIGLSPEDKFKIIYRLPNLTEELVDKYITDDAIGLSPAFKSMIIARLPNLTEGFVDKWITDDAIGLSPAFKSIIIGRLPNLTKEFVDKWITDDAIGLSSTDKAQIICRLPNITEEQVDKYIKDGTIGLMPTDKAQIICRLPNLTKEFVDKWITDDAIGLSSTDKAQIICRLPNITEEQVDKYIKDGTIGLMPTDKANVICSLPDITAEYVRKWLTDEKMNFLLEARQRIAMKSPITRDIITDLENTNSRKLARISTEIALQICLLPEEERTEKIKNIKGVYLSADLPEFAQKYLVFQQLHPNFFGEENVLYADRTTGLIPSLNNSTPVERKHIIFSDLLRIAVESNDKDLKDYLNTIEQGNAMFEMVKEGSLQIDDSLSEDKRETLKKYSDILNILYNFTSKGRRAEKRRENSGDLEKDLEELEELFQSDENIHMNMPDRIVRTFGYWAGIRDFQQAKQLIEEKIRQADSRNRKLARKGDFTVRKGDFAKGVMETQYFPSMLRSGIVAKDYLGESADSDLTPFDTDTELIKEDGVMLTANKYTNTEVEERNLGKIILVIKNDGSYVQTREGKIENKENIEIVKNDRTKKEFFDNNDIGGTNAYGIRTGIGSTNISYIIADRYVDKLGLEIAMNGFYIPIVDEKGKILFTPEMYDDIRSRMQGLSYYGLTEFSLDESAKNEGVEQIIEVIEQSKKDASFKREKILQTLKTAIESEGITMSSERVHTLMPNIAEVVDTGSTGRGTNEPGDGDFDFMIRLDNRVKQNPGRT